MANARQLHSVAPVRLEDLDWEVLDRLRAAFLSETRTKGPYWHTLTDLACYDTTYGERIGWKWDAVLSELHQRGWSIAGRPVLLDWGCGSGVAGRRLVEFLGPAGVGRLVVHDHSALAMDYAEHRARREYPEVTVDRADHHFLREGAIDVLVVSHVLNELDADGLAELESLLTRASAVVWVEPGTHEVSRALVGWRERMLAQGFHAVAPCPHGGACGVLAPGNERHWCHFFAAPPSKIFSDSDWVKFGRRAGIDLRSLPYCFLVLDRRPTGREPGWSRVIGEPRFHKGYARLFNCDAGGVSDLVLQQRTDRALFKSLRHATGPLSHRWRKEGGKIISTSDSIADLPPK